MVTRGENTDVPVVRIEYLQSLTYQGEEKPAEAVEVSARVLYDALATGWLRETFTGRSRGTDFLVFLAIALHARPLRGADLELLIQLGVATPEDEGRLYARVTDVGLAEELGIDARQTIAAATKRLEETGLINILLLPEDFRDSGGQFAGCKAYLISGELTMLRKEIMPASEGPAVLTKLTRSSPSEGPTVLTEPTRCSSPRGSTVLTKLTHVLIKLTQIGGGGGGENDSLLSLQQAFPQASEVDLNAIAALYKRAGLPFDDRARAAFELLGRRFACPGRDMSQWLASAVEEAIIQGADHIPAYVRSVIARWDQEAQGRRLILPLSAGDMPMAPRDERQLSTGSTTLPARDVEDELLIGDRPASEVWQQVLDQLELRMTKPTFATWLQPTRITGGRDHILTVAVPNTYTKDWLENRLLGVIQRAVCDVLGAGWEVSFVVAESEETRQGV